jgi:phage tail-like protein
MTVRRVTQGTGVQTRSSDSFTGAAGTLLSAHVGELAATWTKNSSGASTSDALLSDANRVRKDGGAAQAVYYTSFVPTSPDYAVECVFRLVGGTPNNSGAGVIGRSATNADTYYWGRIFVDATLVANIDIRRFNSGGNLVLGTYAIPNFDVGKDYRIRMVMRGARISMDLDGVEVLSVVDTAPLTDAGRAGLRWGTLAGSDTEGFHLDSFRVFDNLTAQVQGLPLGYMASVGVRTSLGAPDTGTADIVLDANVSAPLVVLTNEGKTAEEFTPDDPEVYGGDVFLYTTPTAEWLFSRLTDAMQARDAAAGGHLEQLMRVLGTGLTEARDLADNVVDLIDVDTCPAEFLPHLGHLLGFEFPYDLDEAMQRNFIRSIVALYRVKGTPMALSFVVNRIIAGKGFTLSVSNESYLTKTFDVRLMAEDTAEGSDALQAKVVYLVGIYAPAGLTPTVVIVFFYQDQQDATRWSDTQHTTIAHVRWSYNQPGHAYTKLNASGKVTYTAQGQQVLTI